MAEGESVCVLCGGPADQVGRFCTTCVGFQGPASTPRWARGVRVAPARLKMLQALRWPLVALLLVGMGVSGARAAESWVAIGQLRRVTGVGRAVLSDQRVHALVGVERRLALLQLGVAAAIGVVFLLWWGLAYRNLGAMGIQVRSQPSWAVLSWFVPLVSLVAPRRMAEELWWGSDARTPLGWSYRPGTLSSLVTGWWTCWVASLVLPPLALVGVTATAAARPTQAMQAVVGSGAAFLLSAVLLGVAGLCAIALVLNVTANQAERASAIEAAGLAAPAS